MRETFAETMSGSQLGLKIKEIAEQYMTLEAVSTYFHGLCPVHDDHNPSLVVWPETNTWRCYACQTGGGPVEFVAFVEHITLGEAREQLSALISDEVLLGNTLAAMAARREIRHRYDVRPRRARLGWSEVIERLKADPWWSRGDSG